MIFGLGDIKHSARQLADFVDEVLRRTGAQQVDLVGFSQGGMMPRYFLNALGGGPKVHNFVGIAPSNHGVTAQGLMNLARQIPGAWNCSNRAPSGRSCRPGRNSSTTTPSSASWPNWARRRRACGTP